MPTSLPCLLPDAALTVVPETSAPDIKAFLKDQPGSKDFASALDNKKPTASQTEAASALAASQTQTLPLPRPPAAPTEENVNEVTDAQSPSSAEPIAGTADLPSGANSPAGSTIFPGLQTSVKCIAAKNAALAAVAGATATPVSANVPVVSGEGNATADAADEAPEITSASDDAPKGVQKTPASPTNGIQDSTTTSQSQTAAQMLGVSAPAGPAPGGLAQSSSTTSSDAAKTTAAKSVAMAKAPAGRQTKSGDVTAGIALGRGWDLTGGSEAALSSLKASALGVVAPSTADSLAPESFSIENPSVPVGAPSLEGVLPVLGQGEARRPGLLESSPTGGIATLAGQLAPAGTPPVAVTVSGQDTAAADTSGVASVATPPAPVSTPEPTTVPSATFPSAEKFAAKGELQGRFTLSGVNSSNGVRKNDMLDADNKQVKKTYQNVGTDTANQGETTMYSLRQPADLLNRFTGPVTEVRSAAAGQAETPAPQASESRATQSAQAVAEIHELASTLASDNKRTVELRFDFGQRDQLSVKVEYRNGAVHTTFRTDSPELREALSSAWQSQSASATPVVKMADPVFTAAPVEQKGFSMNGGNDSRQQQQRAFEETRTQAQYSTFGFSASPGASTSSPLPAAAVASDRHLQAFA